MAHRSDNFNYKNAKKANFFCFILYVLWNYLKTTIFFYKIGYTATELSSKPQKNSK